MSHLHEVREADGYFVIDPVSKTITNESDGTNLVQYDHKSEIVSFKIPRYIENHDMLKCDVARVHFKNTSIGTSISDRETNEGLYIIDDLGDSPNEEDYLVCTWPISQDATLLAGTITFKLEFICYGEDGESIEYILNTLTYSALTVNEGMNCSSLVIEKNPDILLQFEQRIAALENGSGTGGGSGATSEQIAQIEQNTKNIEEIQNAGYATEDYVNTAVSNINIPSIESLATEEYVDNAIANIEIPEGSGQVTSVNGKIGAVRLTAEDVGALPDTTEIPSLEGYATEQYVDDAIANIDIPEGSGAVTSVNGKIGAVELNAEDVGALPDTTEIPSIVGLATEEYVRNYAQPKGEYLTLETVPTEVMIDVTDEEAITNGASLVLNTNAVVDPDEIFVTAAEVENVVSNYVGNVLLWENTESPFGTGDTITIATDGGTDGCTGLGNISDYTSVLVEFKDYSSVARITGTTMRGGIIGCTSSGAIMGYSYYIALDGNALTFNKMRSVTPTTDGNTIADSAITIQAIYGMPSRRK